jgi:hypothetical protein
MRPARTFRQGRFSSAGKSGFTAPRFPKPRGAWLSFSVSCTRFAPLGAAALLAIAVYSLRVVKGFGWTWNTGGYEYPVFWAITSLAVALEAWKAHLRRARPALAAHPLKVGA